MVRALLLLVVACGGSSPSPSPSPSPTTSPSPATVQGQYGWLVGRWQNAQGVEYWTAAGDALFGVAFTGGGWEPMILSERDGKVIFEAAPGGAAPTLFEARPRGERMVVFARQHDPASILYARTGDRLHAEVQSPGDALPIEIDWTLAGAGRAPELEAADRRWNDEVGKRGVDAWVEAFDAEGVQRGGPGEQLTTTEARRQAMEPVLAASFRLIWQPVASGLSAGGDLGFTVGTWHYDAGTVTKARGAYLTLWRRQSDGGWKVLWDGGDPQS